MARTATPGRVLVGWVLIVAALLPIMRAPGGLAGELETAPVSPLGDVILRTPQGAAALPPAESDAGTDSVFIFAAPEHQGVVAPRSGQLSLTLTDLSVQAGASSLELRRRLEPRPAGQGLLGNRWRFNWEIHLDHLGSVAVVHDEAGPVLLTADGSGKEYRSAAGERLTIGGEQRTYTRLDGTTDVFDAQGRIMRREGRGGSQFVVSYDAGNRLSRIDGSHGGFLQFALDEAGRATRVRGSNGASVEYAFSDGELAAVTSDQGGSVAYSYGEQGLLSRIDHPQFGRLAFRYDDRGRVLSRRWVDGAEETWAYDDQSRTVRHTDPAGAVTTYRTSADHRQEETIDASGHKTVVLYNEAGQVRQVTGPTGQTVTNTYDDQARITRIETPRAGSMQFEYQGESRQPTSVVGPSGRRLAFDYSAENNLVGVREGGSPSVAFDYGPAKRINKVRGCDGRDVLLTYDDRGRVRSISHAPGIATELEYDLAGNVIRQKDPSGGVTSWTYDTAGRLTSLREPDGAITQYRYAPSGLLEEIIDPCGAATRCRHRSRAIEVAGPANRTTLYAFDAAGRLESITRGKGDCSRFEYDATGNLARFVDPLGGVTTRTYDPLRRLIEETAPDGGATRCEYDDAGRLTRIVGPGGQSERYDYDAQGQLAKVTDDAGRESRYEYDPAGRIVRFVDAAGRETRYLYTACGLVAKIVPPDGPATELAYDASRNLAQAKRGDYAVSLECDALGNPLKERDTAGLEVFYRYDSGGNLLSRKDNLGGDHSMRYDPCGRLVELVDSAGAAVRLSYDLAGNLLSLTDAHGRVKRFRHTEAGELAEVVEANGDTARYEYDQAGNLAAVIHPGGGKTEYVYDAAGNVQQVTDPVGASRQSSYDSVGRLAGTTDARGRKTTCAYDAAGRLIQKRLADGKVVAYRYDDYGNLAEVDDGEYPVRYRYDVLENTTQIEYPAIRRTLQYQYDARGRLAEFTDSEGQRLVYTYDTMDRLARVETADGERVSFAYDAKGRVTRRTYPNGVTGTWEYDGEDRVVRIQYANPAGEVVSQLQYKYDLAGNPVEITDAAGRAALFQYDASGQLVSETTRDGKTIRYTYAPGGNRATREVDGKTTAYRYDAADRLLQAGEEAFTYDANGNLIERTGPRGTTRYEYDPEDRLVKAVLPDGGEVRFGYAPTGERVWREDSRGKTCFVTDGVNLLAELDGGLKAKATYVHGPGIDQPLFMADGRGKYFYQTDAIGTITGLTDSSGKPAAAYEADAFGNLAASAGNVGNPFVFTARQFDADLGIYYFRARYYDPALGRFLTRDPADATLSVPGSLNPYQYAHNSPLVFIDPLGAETWDAAQFPWYDKQTHIELPQELAQPSDLDKTMGRKFSPTARGQYNAAHDKVWTYPAAGQKGSASWWTTVMHEFVHREDALMYKRHGMERAVDRMEARAYARAARFGVQDLGLPVGHPEVQRQIEGFVKKGGATPAERTALEKILQQHAATPVGQAVPASGFRPWLNQNPGTALGVIGAVGLANCAYWSGDPTGCVLSAVPWMAGGAVITAAVGPQAAMIASIPIGAFSAGYGVHQAVREGTGAWTARQAAEEAERQARQAQEAAGSRGDDIVTSLGRQIEELTALREQILRARRNAKAEAQAAVNAEKSVQSGLAALRMKQNTVDGASDNALLAPGIRDEIAADAWKAEQGEKLVHALLDATDAQAGRVSSLDQQAQVLNDYGTAEKLVSDVAQAAERARGRNADLTKIVWAAGQARREMESIPKLKTSMAEGAAAARKSLESAYAQLEEIARFTEALKQGAADLSNRISRARILLGSDAAKLDDVQSRLAAVAALPADDAGPLVATAQTAVDRLGASLKQADGIAVDGVDLGEGIVAADEAVARAEAAKQRAMERLARSRALRDQVAAWRPGQPADATGVPDFGEGITVIAPPGMGDVDQPPDFGEGITVIRPPGIDEGGQPPDFGEGITVIRPPADADPDTPPDFGQGVTVVDPGPSAPPGGAATGERPSGGTAIGRRPPARSATPEAESPRGPITIDEPLYAVYGIHAWSVPVVPENIQRIARSRDGRYTANLLGWIDSLTVRDVWPAAQPTSFLAFHVSGEMLREYQAHLNAGNAGEGGEDYWLFRYGGGYYHQTFTITTPTGDRFQAPLFLSFQVLFSGGKPPEKYCLAKISLMGPTVELRGTPPLNNKRAPGAGWQFSDSLKMHYAAGPIEYDGNTRWSDATHRLAVEHAKRVLRFGVQAAVGIGEAVGEAIGEAFGGGFF